MDRVVDPASLPDAPEAGAGAQNGHLRSRAATDALPLAIVLLATAFALWPSLEGGFESLACPGFGHSLERDAVVPIAL